MEVKVARLESPSATWSNRDLVAQETLLVVKDLDRPELRCEWGPSFPRAHQDGHLLYGATRA